MTDFFIALLIITLRVGLTLTILAVSSFGIGFIWHT